MEWLFAIGLIVAHFVFLHIFDYLKEMRLRLVHLENVVTRPDQPSTP